MRRGYNILRFSGSDRNSVSLKRPLIFLIILILLALFADVIATDQPLYIQYKGKTMYPALSSVFNPSKVEIIDSERLQFDITEWRELEADKVIWAPVPYSPGKPDPLNRDYISPFDNQKFLTRDGKAIPAPLHFRHHLGTDAQGHDVLSILIHGCRVTLKVGIFSVLIAFVVGVFLGALAGYYGDWRVHTSRASWYMAIIGAFFGYFWGFEVRLHNINDAFAEGFLQSVLQILLSVVIFAATIFLFSFIGKLLNWIPFLNRKVSIPFDSIVQRSSEIFTSLPRLLIILTIAAVFREKTIGMVIAIIGLTSWPSIARFTRAEMLKTRDLSYIEAARAIGLSDLKVILKHALPNAIGPVMIEVAFLIAGSILIESSLSFLGIGIPDDLSTWGGLLSAGRQQFDAWWLVLFPGLAIFLTVLLFNLLGEGLKHSITERKS